MKLEWSANEYGTSGPGFVATVERRDERWQWRIYYDGEVFPMTGYAETAEAAQERVRACVGASPVQADAGKGGG